MGQDTVYQFLQKNKSKWFTSKEIAKELRVGTSSVSTNLKRLRKRKTVFFKSNPSGRNEYLYMVK